ncbi:MAG: hypothetical protein ABH824_04985 [Nanoarchaeota archaeon]|nr:hypothetical protein [Nanoarchaeota archaeon]MBU1632479.1 hypothetical protein [Nanoarchaeota archaeon]MBU1875989.1 hypothetical protein [Nanoarchaeota archaeon]
MESNEDNRRILVVSNSFNKLSLYISSLRWIGYHEVGKAGNLSEALEQVRKFEPNLVLVDSTRSSNVGLGICRDIRQSCSSDIIIAGVYSKFEHGDLSKSYQKVGADGSIEESIITSDKQSFKKELEKIIQGAYLKRSGGNPVERQY